MPSLISHSYRFGDFAIDVDERVILRANKPLALTPKMFDTLLILVENGGRLVKKEELMTRLWPDTFVEEANLAVNIQQLRKALGDNARRPRYIETVARRGYRFIATVEEVLSENGQLASQTIQRVQSVSPGLAPGSGFDPKPSQQSESASAGEPVSGRSALGVGAATRQGTTVGMPALAVVAAVAIVLVVGGLLWTGSTSQPQPSGTRTMVAVMPFKNLTGDSAQEYLSDGLTEEMIAQLGNLDPQQFGIIARTSVMHYKNSQKPLDQIGRELGVEYVLEGSVRRDSDRVRIAAQLIQVRDQTHIWSRQYDRELPGLLALQGEIGQDIAKEIQRALGKPKPSDLARKPRLPQSYEAYDLWLRGQYFFNKRTAEDFPKATDYFQRAIDKDPAYARGHVGLASAYALMGGYTMRPQTEFMPKARAAAMRAVELDETSAEAHTVLALIVQNYDLNWQKAEVEFRRAIELNPSYATAHHWYAEHLMWRGRFEDALRESDEARRLDPHSLIILADRGAIFYYARQYDRAIDHFLAVRELDPKFQRTGLIIHAYEQKGLFAEAVADIRSHPPPHGMSPPWYWSELTYAYGRSGQQAEAQNALQHLLDLNQEQELGAEAVIWAYLGVGDNERALAWLEKAYAQRSPALTYLKVDPRFDPLRSDSRFQDLLRRVGLQ